MPRRTPAEDDSVSYRADDDTLAALFGGSRTRSESRGSRRVRALVAVVVSLALLAALGWGVLRVARSLRPVIPLPEQCIARAEGRTVVLSHDQMHHAALIAGTAVREGFGERGATIALATALQESSLRNLDGGDLDSVGLFQQRPSQGWGTREQIMDPHYATETFLAALAKVDWRHGDVGTVAQSVQHSGVPDGYDKRVPDAGTLAAVLTGRVPAGLTCLDRQHLPPSSGELAGELNQTWGVNAAAQGSTLRVTGATDEIAWAWAAFAVANMRAHGVVAVQVGDQRWQADDTQQGGWVSTTTPAPLAARQVLITFRT